MRPLGLWGCDLRQAGRFNGRLAVLVDLEVWRIHAVATVENLSPRCNRNHIKRPEDAV